MVRRIAILFTMIFCATQFLILGASAALDDGYPEGKPAPMRSCPDSAVGDKHISEISEKILICTLINNEKRWWIENEPLPLVPSGLTPVPITIPGGTPIMLPEIKHDYFLPVTALEKMKVVEDIVYATDSTAQKLDIYLPKNVKNPPLVIWLHGGAFMFLDKSVVRYDESAKILELLIKNKIAVAVVDYRLATEAKFPAAGQDVKSAIRYLRANALKYGYDAKKFAVWGESSGGYLALMAGITGKQKSIFDSPSDVNKKVSAEVMMVVELSGSADFLSMEKSVVKYPCKANIGKSIPAMENPWFGSKAVPGVSASMKSANLYPLIQKNSKLPAFYLYHGSEDCFVSKYEATQFNNSIKKVGGKVVLNIVPGGTHGGASVWSEASKVVGVLKQNFTKAK